MTRFNSGELWMRSKAEVRWQGDVPGPYGRKFPSVTGHVHDMAGKFCEDSGQILPSARWWRVGPRHHRQQFGSVTPDRSALQFHPFISLQQRRPLRLASWMSWQKQWPSRPVLPRLHIPQRPAQKPGLNTGSQRPLLSLKRPSAVALRPSPSTAFRRALSDPGHPSGKPWSPVLDFVRSTSSS